MIKFCYGAFDENSNGYDINWSSETIDLSLRREIVDFLGNIGSSHSEIDSSENHFFYSKIKEYYIFGGFNFTGVDRVGRINCKSAIGLIFSDFRFKDKLFNILDTINRFNVEEVFNTKIFNLDINEIRKDFLDFEYVKNNRTKIEEIISSIIGLNKFILKYDFESKKLLKSIYYLLADTEYKLKSFTTFINIYDDYNSIQLSIKAGCHNSYFIGNNLVSQFHKTKAKEIVDAKLRFQFSDKESPILIDMPKIGKDEPVDMPILEERKNLYSKLYEKFKGFFKLKSKSSIG